MTRHLPTVQLNFSTFSLLSKNECLEYKNLLEEFEPHIIHSHRYLAEFLTSYYVSDRYKYVCHGHDNMIQLRKFKIQSLFNKRAILNYLEKLFLVVKKYKRVKTYFIANSKHTENYFRGILPKSCKKEVSLIECGFDYHKFFNGNKMDITETKKLKIINVGSFKEKKNQAFIVDIALELRSRAVDFEVSLLGNGLLKADVEEKVKRLDLVDNFHFLGNVSDVENYLKESHIYLHTATYEPFGLVFLEAMASGLPCIALDGKGNRDLIVNDKNGYLLDQQSASSFADTILNLFKDPVKYRKISEFNKKFAQSFDIKLKANELIEFYKRVLV